MHSVKASERSGSYTTSEAEQKKWMLAPEGLELRSGIFFWAKFKRHIPHCKPSSPCFSTASGNSTRSQLTSYSRVLVCLFFLLTARIDFDVRIRALCFARAESQPSLLRAHHGLQQLPARHLLLVHFSTTAPAAFSASSTQDLGVL